MKLSCLQENLNKGLNIVNHVSPTNVSLPILTNVLLKARKENLILITTDLEIGIQTSVRSKVEKEGEFTVPINLLAPYVSLLPNQLINLELTKNDLLIKCEKNQTRIKGIEASEFPLIPKIEKKEKFVLNSQELKKAIQKVIFSINPNEVRSEISGALFYFNYPKENKLTLTGTDSYRLAEKVINLTEGFNKRIQKTIIPLKILQEVVKIINSEKEFVEVYLSENQILFSQEETEIICRIISGDYPDYQTIIPQGAKTKVIVDRENFIKAVKTTSLFSRLGINDIHLKINPPNKMVISSLNSQLGENITEIEADVSGESNSIVFNYHYLLDGLSNIETPEINLEIIDENKPGLIKPAEEQNYLYVIMPIRQEGVN